MIMSKKTPIQNQLNLQVHFLNQLNTLMLLKILVQICSPSVFEWKYLCYILIINIKYEYILIFSLT